MKEQAVQTLANMKAVLEAAGLAVTDIAKTTVFVTNMDDFAAFNEVYAAFMGEHRPGPCLCGSQQHCPRLSAGNGCHLL